MKQDDQTDGNVHMPDQADQPIPGYFSGNDNCHSKLEKSSKTKMGWIGRPGYFPHQSSQHFEITIYQLTTWHKGNRITDFGKFLMAARKRDIFSQNTGKLPNFDMGHLP